jgi:DNA-binding beta-propeller fold protein YncE
MKVSPDNNYLVFTAKAFGLIYKLNYLTGVSIDGSSLFPSFDEIWGIAINPISSLYFLGGMSGSP